MGDLYDARADHRARARACVRVSMCMLGVGGGVSKPQENVNKPHILKRMRSRCRIEPGFLWQGARGW